MRERPTPARMFEDHWRGMDDDWEPIRHEVYAWKRKLWSINEVPQEKKEMINDELQLLVRLEILGRVFSEWGDARRGNIETLFRDPLYMVPNVHLAVRGIQGKHEEWLNALAAFKKKYS